MIHLGSDEIGVARLAPPPALRGPTKAHETAVLRALSDATSAGLLPGRPPEGFGRSLARAATDEPGLASARIRTGIVNAYSDTTNLAVIRTAFSPVTAIPGEQPRGAAAGGRPGQVHEPGAGYDAAAAALGLRVFLFDDSEHLRAWVADSLSRSLVRAVRRGRPQEIAATGVRRPVIASMVLLQFADGTSAQWAPMVSDGISRFAICAATLLGELHSDPETAGPAIAKLLLPTNGLTPSSPSYELARLMRRHHDSLIREYRLHIDEDVAAADAGAGGLDEVGVRMRQFFTLPADLHLLASDPETGAPSSMEPGMEAVVSDFHTGVDGWEQEDDSRHTALRALKRLAEKDDISAELIDLCANRANLGDAPALRPMPAGDTAGATGEDPGTAGTHCVEVSQDRLLLRRAVTLLATLLGPTTYPAFKAALRHVSGRQRLTLQQTVEYAAALVCEPWATQKPGTRSWAYGGPAPTWIQETQLVPAHPADYLDLVRTALDQTATDAAVTAAQLELALAGGTALISDGILTTALTGGSGGAAAPLPYRGAINGAVEALTRTEEGLTALAVAANHFRPSQSARSARLPAIDLDRPDRVSRDGMGVAVRTTETVLAQYAALAEAARVEPEPPPESPSEPTPLENLRSRARQLPDQTRSLLQSIELTKTLHDETGGPTGLSEDDRDAVHDSLSEALKLVGRLT